MSSDPDTPAPAPAPVPAPARAPAPVAAPARGGRRPTHLVVAANNAAVSGGELMGIAIADIACRHGAEVTVVGPRAADDGPTKAVLDLAADRGFETVAFPPDRRGYLRALRRWDDSRPPGVLWCNGLVPAFATAGHSGRVVHLHQEPGRLHGPAIALAQRGADATFVPSVAMTRLVPHSQPLLNWTEDIDLRPPPGIDERARAPHGEAHPPTLGYVGRLTTDKGVDVLARALALLADRCRARGTEPPRLRIVGDARLVPPADHARVRAALAEVEDLLDRPGWVPRADIFTGIDIAVFPSVWFEAFGLVAAEAMAAGTPVVVSDAGALPEVVGEGHPWIARTGDPADLARVLAEVMALPGEAIAPVVAAGRARWLEQFSPAAGEARVVTILARLGVLPASGPA